MATDLALNLGPNRAGISLRSPAFAPASFSRRIPTIGSAVNLDRFTSVLSRGGLSLRVEEDIRGRSKTRQR